MGAVRAIRVRHFPETNTKPAKLIADARDGVRVVVSYPVDVNNDDDAKVFAARKLCEKYGWHGTICPGYYNGDAYFVFVEDGITVRV